jgi:hypothetical protein
VEPVLCNRRIYRGDDVLWEFLVPYLSLDLSGYFVESKMRASWDSSIVVPFTAFIYFPGDPFQKISISLLSASSTLIPVYNPLYPKSIDPYYWDLELTDPLGKVWKLLRGDVSVYYEATR